MPSETKQLDDDMAELRASIDRLTKDVASLSHSLTEVVKSRVGDAAGDIRDGVKTAASAIGETSKDSKDTIERTIRERPFQSLLCAFGVGILISQLFRRQGTA